MNLSPYPSPGTAYVLEPIFTRIGAPASGTATLPKPFTRNGFTFYPYEPVTLSFTETGALKQTDAVRCHGKIIKSRS